MNALNMTYRKEGHVGFICLGAPPGDKWEMASFIYSMKDLCSEISIDKEIHVIVLTGTREDSFSVEMGYPEIPFMAGAESQGQVRSMAEPLSQYAKPVIGAFHGDVIGQGLELALVCDLRIATKSSYFQFPQITYGLIPWDGGTQRLTRVVGKAKAIEMIITGERVGAQEAYRIGLLNRMVNPDELMASASKLAHDVASKSPICLAYAKEAVSRGMDLTLEQGLRLEANLYFLLQTTNDHKEGIQAFREKRKTAFEGR